MHDHDGSALPWCQRMRVAQPYGPITLENIQAATGLVDSVACKPAFGKRWQESTAPNWFDHQPPHEMKATRSFMSGSAVSPTTPESVSAHPKKRNAIGWLSCLWKPPDREEGVEFLSAVSDAHCTVQHSATDEPNFSATQQPHDALLWAPTIVIACFYSERLFGTYSHCKVNKQCD